MKTLAIIDLLFNWPPDGGARLDIKEVATRLSDKMKVILFAPDFQRFFPRGNIRQSLPFEVETIPFDHFSFNFFQVPKAFLKCIQQIQPDYVMIGDGWFLKPYLTLAFADFKPVVRYYAYENMCLRSNGTLFVNNDFCPVDFLAGHPDDIKKCILCGRQFFNDRLGTLWGQEFYASLAHTKKYRNTVIKSISSSRRILCNNRLISERFSRYNPHVEIVHSGVDLNLFAPTALGKKEKMDEDGKKVILMTGRSDDPVKGFEYLKKAGAILWKKRQDFIIQVTSQNSHRFTEPYLQNIGWFTQNELPAIYNHANFCIFPSIWAEPFGIIALEALACEKPAIVFNRGGLSETIRDGETGYIIPAGDIDSLVAKMDFLLDHPEEVRRMGQQGRQFIKTHYTWDTIIDKHYLPLFPP